jgi:hypothetical protein
MTAGFLPKGTPKNQVAHFIFSGSATSTVFAPNTFCILLSPEPSLVRKTYNNYGLDMVMAQ